LLIFLKYGIFLNKKIALFKKMLTEQEAIHRVRLGQLQLPPLMIKLYAEEQAAIGQGKTAPILTVSWQNREQNFGVVYKSRSTPKEFQSALDQTSYVNKTYGLQPMILMPFLNEKQLLELAERQISGIDFSGNGVVVVPERLFVFRSGSPNHFPAFETIQNVYRKNSSIVSRAFLAHPVFDSVNSIEAFIQMRGGNGMGVSLSTVSKVLKVLEEDLIISREKGEIRLLQPEKLLDNLATHFVRPSIRRFLVGKSPYEAEALTRLLSESAFKHQVWLTGTGVGSIAQYAVMARENFLSVYCTDQYRLLAGIEFKETSRFPNLEVIETHDKTVYFDSRMNKGFEWASPIQTYLELMAGDQRERDTAAQVKITILENAKRQLL
jgi:hypothetical protein